MRWRAMAAIVAVLGVVTTVGVLGVRYDVIAAVQDRIATPYTIGEAQFSPPGLLTWPRLTEDQARSSCDFCDTALMHSAGTTLEYGVLVSDPGMTAFHDNSPNYSEVPTDVHLPVIAWIIHWPPTCTEPVGPHSMKCATFLLIDDATGWVLDAGQDSRP